MAYYEWTPELDVHVEAMNDHHRGIIDRMNALHEWVATHAPAHEIARGFDALIDYTAMHFAAEEAHMAEVGFEKRPAHIAEHKKLLARLRAFARQHAETGAVGPAFFEFLRGWLYSHIRGIDVQYGLLSVEAPVRTSERPSFFTRLRRAVGTEG